MAEKRKSKLLSQNHIDHVSARANSAFKVAPGNRSQDQKDDVRNYISIFGKKDSDHREAFEANKRAKQ